MARRRHRAWCIHWGTWSLVLALLYLANLPLYAGSSLGSHWRWRMEHGRLQVAHSESPFTESFYVDFNSEGMRFAPECRFHTLREWSVNIPLWIPLALTLTLSALSFRAARRAAKQRQPPSSHLTAHPQNTMP